MKLLHRVSRRMLNDDDLVPKCLRFILRMEVTVATRWIAKDESIDVRACLDADMSVYIEYR